MSALLLNLDAFMTRFVQNHKLQNESLPTCDFDPPWPSHCTELEDNEGLEPPRFWRPVKRGTTGLFESLEQALELTFHQDVDAFYGAYWSDGIAVVHQDFHFNLLQLWNEEDQDNLKENMLGHLFAKRKNRLAPSYFIGCTDGDEVIAIDHETGAIVLERPGRKPHQTLASSLEQLLLELQPDLS